MARSPESVSWLFRIVGTILIVAGLYEGRQFLVPCSLAVLLALMLAPISHALERGRLPRLAAVLVTVIAATSLIGCFGWLVTRQIAGVAGRLPEYRENILAKTTAIGPLGIVLQKGYDLLERSSGDLSPSSTRVSPSGAAEVGALDALGDIFLSIFNSLGTGFVVILLVAFLLIYRDDLRDRLIQLLGAGRVRVTTQAMNDAADNVSRYLLTQSFVNLLYGAILTGILVGLGIPGALLWGILATLARFIPYFGPWLGASLPLFLSLAAFPGWSRFLVLAASWVSLEGVIGNVLEPVLYGRKTGLSPLAVLIAAVFWTWIWGGLGLLLSIPLTVSLVVLGKHFAPLRFLHTLLADDASLEPRLQLYQRLLARDLPAAEDLAEGFLRGRRLADVFDGLILPTLSLAWEDRQSGRLEEEQADQIRRQLSAVAEDLSERAPEPDSPPLAPSASWGHLIVSIPAGDAADEAGARTIERVLSPRRVTLEVLPFSETVGEKVRRTSERSPDLVVLVALHPSPLIPIRYLHKRLRAALPKTDILVALLDAPGDPARWSERILTPDGPPVVTSVAAVEKRVEQLLPALLVKKAAALATLPGPAHL